LRAAPHVPLQLKIVTFNIADGYLFTANRAERMRAIGALLTKLDPDIVGLQESFVSGDRKILLQALSRSRLRYHAEYPAATVGNGLLTLSAFPITEVYFHRFKNSNPWYKIHQGDWWSGKGVGLARIRLPSGRKIDFFNLHAQPDRRDAANRRVRALQMEEMAVFVNRSTSDAVPALVVGDFNTGIEAPDLRQAMNKARMHPAVTLDTGIDTILAVDAPGYGVKVIDTIRLAGVAQGSAAAIFLDRAPTLVELWRMRFGPAEMTPLSDHHGVMSTLSITLNRNAPPKGKPGGTSTV
jgi:endonuclease/exonuclease/phosphatase family metal-dependent hydrolase